MTSVYRLLALPVFLYYMDDSKPVFVNKIIIPVYNYVEFQL